MGTGRSDRHDDIERELRDQGGIAQVVLHHDGGVQGGKVQHRDRVGVEALQERGSVQIPLSLKREQDKKK